MSVPANKPAKGGGRSQRLEHTSSNRSSKGDNITEFSEIEHPKKRAFLRCYALNGNAVRAAKAAKISRSLYWYWQRDDEQFAAAMRDARSIAGDLLESEAFERATRAKNPSDTLLIFLLKGAMPEKYRERSEVTMPGLSNLVERITAGRQRAAAAQGKA